MKFSQNILKDIFFNNTNKSIKIVFNDYIMPGSFVEFTKCLRKNNSIKQLYLINSNMSNSDASALSNALVVNKSLISIKLSKTPLNDFCAGSIAQVIQKNNTLQKIDISKCVISERAAIAIGFALIDNNTLTNIKISTLQNNKKMYHNLIRTNSWSFWESNKMN
jgi:hypothetical protein